MKPLAMLTGWVLAGGSLAAAEPAQLDRLKVLFVGEGGERARVFEGFLAPNVAAVSATSRHTFTPSAAEAFDVVVLDWGQSERTQAEWQTGKSPLGPREQWNKPTVLLGSAGLNLAVVWKVRGGSG